MITRNNFDVPVFEYYKNGGKYSGCKRGASRDDFNYKIAVEQIEEKDPALVVHIWYGEMCYDCSTEVSWEQFPADSDGLSLAYDYIDTAFDTWINR
jgi:hypothetical protein